MTFLAKLFNKTTGSHVRNIIRAVLLAGTAFGFNMSGEQVAAVMLVVEAIFGFGTASSIGN